MYREEGGNGQENKPEDEARSAAEHAGPAYRLGGEFREAENYEHKTAKENADRKMRKTIGLFMHTDNRCSCWFSICFT
jgi:hypothetical protein